MSFSVMAVYCCLIMCNFVVIGYCYCTSISARLEASIVLLLSYYPSERAFYLHATQLKRARKRQK